MKRLFWFLAGFALSMVVGISSAYAITYVGAVKAGRCDYTAFQPLIGPNFSQVSWDNCPGVTNLASCWADSARTKSVGCVYDCPAGTTMDSTGFCAGPPPAPPGASDTQKQKARDAAAAEAKAKGLDSTAQAAAGAKAADVMDKWIQAGKTEAEALQAASAAGKAAAMENVVERYESDRVAATDAARACAAAGRNCDETAFADYNGKIAAAGLDPNASNSLVTKNSDGTSTEYQLLPNGKWDVYEVDASGKTNKYSGTVDTLDFSPTSTTNTAGPPSSSVSTVTSKVSATTTVQDGTSIGRYDKTTTGEQITYFSNSGGTALCTVYRDPVTGAITTSGTCPSTVNPANDFAAAGGRVGSGGGGVASGNSGPVKIDEAGTPSSVDKSSYSASIENTSSNIIKNMQDATKTGSLPWSFNFSLPSSTCHVMEWYILGAVHTFDPCPMLERVRAAMAYLMYGLCAIYLWRSVVGATGGGSK